MDTNWCLYCGHHTDSELPYCSRQCQARDNHTLVDYDDDSHSQIIPILPVSHQSKPPSRYTGRDNDGISAWAAQIPSSASPPPIQDLTTPFYASSSNPSSSSLRPPKLLLPHRKALPPSLCMSTPQPTPPQCSVPIHTPQQPISDLLRDHPRIFGGESMTSLVTDSIATPTSAVVAPEHKPTTFLAQLATQVRSWVASSSNLPHSKPPLHPSEPAIVGIDDDSIPSKSRAYLPDDDLAAFAPAVTKLKWDFAAEQGSDSYDDEELDDYQDSYSPVIPKLSSPTTTPTPQLQSFPAPSSDSSSSILDILVEEFHPAFKARGRQMVRCAS